jgi:hypothetical protein
VWNIQGGIKSVIDSAAIIHDMTKLGIQVCALQDTHCGAYGFSNDMGTIFGLEAPPDTPTMKCFGQGFFNSKALLPHFARTKVISNRISVLQIILNRPNHRRPSMFVIINEYAPHSLYTCEDVDAYYKQLSDTIRT